MMNFESVADTIVNKNISFNVIAIGTSKLDHCLVFVSKLFIYLMPKQTSRRYKILARGKKLVYCKN